MAQESMEKCQGLTEKYIQKLLCDELDIKRQLQIFDAMDQFIKKQMLELSPPDFLGTWARHRSLRQKIASLFDFADDSGASVTNQGPGQKKFQMFASAVADLKLEGGIKITTMAPK